jgi:hypothetical protein
MYIRLPDRKGVAGRHGQDGILVGDLAGVLAVEWQRGGQPVDQPVDQQTWFQVIIPSADASSLLSYEQNIWQ